MLSVRLSFWLSVTFRGLTSSYRPTFFSPIILVFPLKHLCEILPLTGELNTCGVYKFRDFLSNRPRSGRHQRCHRCFLCRQKLSLWNLCLRQWLPLLMSCPMFHPVKNFTLTFAVAAGAYIRMQRPSLLKLYCRYFVCMHGWRPIGRSTNAN